MKKVQKLANDIRNVIDTADKAILRMNIRKILDKHAPIAKPFPKFMKTKECADDSYIVYFISPQNGYFMTEGGGGGVNEYWENFNMLYFEDCELEVKVKGES